MEGKNAIPTSVLVSDYGSSSIGKDMAVASVALKLQYTEGTKQISTVHGETIYHFCVSGEENSTSRTIGRL